MTHEHDDHVDRLRMAGLGLPVHAPAAARIENVGVIALNPGDEFTAAGFRVKAVGGRGPRRRRLDRPAPAHRLPARRHRAGSGRAPRRRDPWLGRRPGWHRWPATRTPSRSPSAAHAGAGADTVVLQPTADDPDPESFIRFVAGEVRPRVP